MDKRKSDIVKVNQKYLKVAKREINTLIQKRNDIQAQVAATLIEIKQLESEIKKLCS